MRNLIRKSVYLIAVALLCFAPCALAQSVSMKLINGGTDVLDGVYVDPYNVQINGVNTQAICDDFSTEVSPGQTWTANVSTFPISSGVKFTTGQQGQTQAQAYAEAAWLVLQMINPTNASQIGDIHFALWEIFDTNAFAWMQAYGDSTNLGLATIWLKGAESQSTFTPSEYFSSFQIYTPTPLNASQEFLTYQVPDSPFVITLAADLLGLGLLALFFRRRIKLWRTDAFARTS
jgi:hypothetical protein